MTGTSAAPTSEGAPDDRPMLEYFLKQRVGTAEELSRDYYLGSTRAEYLVTGLNRCVAKGWLTRHQLQSDIAYEITAARHQAFQELTRDEEHWELRRKLNTKEPFFLAYVYDRSIMRQQCSMDEYIELYISDRRPHIHPDLAAGKTEEQVREILLSRLWPVISREVKWALGRGWVVHASSDLRTFRITSEGIRIVRLYREHH